MAQKVRSRDWYERCYGDKEKIASKRELLETQKREEQLEESQIHLETKAGISKLKASLSTYVERLEAIQKNRDERISQWKKEDEEAELAECTFTPKTTSIPHSTKYQAEEFKMIKKEKEALRTLIEGEALPDWR